LEALSFRRIRPSPVNRLLIRLLSPWPIAVYYRPAAETVRVEASGAGASRPAVLAH
jgi:hypothetical protein